MYAMHWLGREGAQAGVVTVGGGGVAVDQPVCPFQFCGPGGRARCVHVSEQSVGIFQQGTAGVSDTQEQDDCRVPERSCGKFVAVWHILVAVWHVCSATAVLLICS